MSLTKFLAPDGTTVQVASAANPLPVVLDGAAGGEATLAEQQVQTGVLQEIKQSNAAIKTAAQDTTTINVAQDSAVMKLANVSVTPKFASVALSASGDVVALVSAKKIRVLAYCLVCGTATTVKFQSGGTTDKTGAMPFAANGGISAPFNPVGWFETAAGEKLNLVLGASAAVAGHLTYIEV